MKIQSLLPSLLNITSGRKHTRTNPEDSIIATRTVYLSLSAEGDLRYRVRLESKEIATGLIDKDGLKEIHQVINYV